MTIVLEIRALIYDPWDFEQDEVEELLFHERLVFPNELLVLSLLRARAVRFWAEIGEVLLEQRESFLRRFGFGLWTGGKHPGEWNNGSAHFNREADIVGW